MKSTGDYQDTLSEYDVVFSGGECPNCEENRIDRLQNDDGVITCLDCGTVYYI